MGRHLRTAVQFTYHKIKHRYLKLNKTPAQIAEELGLDGGFVSKVCDHIFFTDVQINA